MCYTLVECVCVCYASGMSTNEQQAMVRVGLNLPANTRHWLKVKAAESNTDMSKLVAQILQNHIDSVEGPRKSDR